MSHRYAGFVSQVVTEAKLAYQPGTSRDLQAKAFQIDYCDQPKLAAELNASVAASASETLNLDAYKKPPKEKEVCFLPIPKQCVDRSVVGGTYVNFEQETQDFASITPEDVDRAFQAVDIKQEGYIIPSELRMLARGMLGRDATPRQLKVLEMHLKGPRDKKISLDTVMDTIPKCIDYLFAETYSLRPSVVKGSVTTAGWHRARQDLDRRAGLQGAGGHGATLVMGGGSTSGSASLSQEASSSSSSSSGFEDSMGSSSLGSSSGFATTTGAEASPKRTIRSITQKHVTNGWLTVAAPEPSLPYNPGFLPVGAVPQSSTQIDVGMAPDSRPTKDPTGAGFWHTTRDLSAGTPRVTKHAPGFQGHIPREPLGHTAEVGLGEKKRDTFNSSTNLTQTFHRRIPGFSGHLPEFVPDASSFDVRKPMGAAAATDYERANYAIKQYWDAKNSMASK